MQCARHPSVETALTCTRCETPICPKCLVPGAVGMLCKSCAGNNPLHEVPIPRLALGLALGLAGGTVAGVLLQSIGFFLFFVAPAIGGALGQAVLWAVKGRRGPRVVALAGVGAVGGALLSTLLTGVWRYYLASPVGAIWFVVGVVLCTGAALARIHKW